MDFLSNFSENILALMSDNNLSVDKFAEIVEIDLSEVYRYLREEYIPKLSNIIKIADSFNCSIKYLIGDASLAENGNFKTQVPFSQRFKELLAKKGISRYRLSKDTNISINRIDDWYYGRFTPSLEKALKLAEYFNCSIDYLLGRE